MIALRLQVAFAVAALISFGALGACGVATPTPGPGGDAAATVILTAPESGGAAPRSTGPGVASSSSQASQAALGSRVSRPSLSPGRDTTCVNGLRGNAVQAASPPPGVLGGILCATVMVDGYVRDFLVYLPEQVLSPAPLVFMYHGSGGTGPQFLRISGWREKADATGLVAIFPTGAEYFVLDERRFASKWNDFSLSSHVDLTRKPRDYPTGAPWPADDVKFTRIMIDAIRNLVTVDERRIFVSGFSNGSAMVARLAVEASDIIDAAAGNTGLLQKVATPLVRIPRFVTMGNEDDGIMAALGTTRPLPMTFEGLRAFAPLDAGFNTELATWLLKDPPAVTRRSGITLARWADAQPGNTAGNVLQFAILQGMEHNYPNGRNNDAGFAAATEFWSFFLDPSQR